jgi:hypothetical protein
MTAAAGGGPPSPDAQIARSAPRQNTAPARELSTRDAEAPAASEHRGAADAAADADQRHRLSDTSIATRDEPGDDALPPVHVVESQFAGIVYLVNLALHLELYADFTVPARPGLDLPLGDFLALAGERVCGDAFRADPVWSVLAELAGREPLAPPGREFRSVDGRDLRLLVDEWTLMLAACAAPVLEVDEPAALPLVCARAGRLALSQMRLDVTFDLAAHPLTIRKAGIDRDPGWVPAAGRVIAFHYE